MEKALLHMANCYLIPNIRGTGYLCKTNISSNTAFRGFGAPQVRESEYESLFQYFFYLAQKSRLLSFSLTHTADQVLVFDFIAGSWKSRMVYVRLTYNLVPRVSRLTAPWGERGGGGTMRDPENEVG